MIYFAKHSSRMLKSTVSYLIYEHDGKDGLIEVAGYTVMDTVKGKYALLAFFCLNCRTTR